MDGLLAIFAVFGGFAAVMGLLLWLGIRLRRRGVGGQIMGPIDEIYHPAAHRFRQEVQVQEERLAPRPGSDDQWRRSRRDDVL
jgi:hypothetical protein